MRLFHVVLAAVMLTAAGGAGADEGAFRVRPYLQNPAPDAMTVRWLSHRETPGVLVCDGRRLDSTPVAADVLDYHAAEPADLRHAAPPFLHAVRIDGLQPTTSYPYTVEQDGESIRAILTTAPRPGEVGRGGAVRLFFYADSETQPESRGNRVAWPPSTALPGGPRPRWVADRYLVDETTGYRMNLALMAARSAESLRAGNPVLAGIVGDLVETGDEQRDWDEFWRHNAGEFSGHDEMYEHSFDDGVHYYDVGIGGDGLRGPHPGLVNARQIFLAHDHAPEHWQGDVLVSGGKHYGHVEVDVVARDDGRLAVTITPVHVFPVLDPAMAGSIVGWERRTYDDIVTFDVPAPATAASLFEEVP